MTKKVISKINTNEEAIKKSLFIGVCFQVENTEDFFRLLNQYQDENATHNCWAYRLGNEYRFNDDGEPSGTAGKPILAAIDGAGFDYLGALVIRHYGGIKLGTGGLARAYGGTIAKNLKTASYELFVEKVRLKIDLGFEYSQILHQLIEQFDGSINKQIYNEKGTTNQVTLPQSNLTELKQLLNDHSKGSVFIQSLENDQF